MKRISWRGTPIEEMTKDELLVVVRELAEMVGLERNEHTRQLHFMNDMRRGRLGCGIFGSTI